MTVVLPWFQRKVVNVVLWALAAEYITFHSVLSSSVHTTEPNGQKHSCMADGGRDMLCLGIMNLTFGDELAPLVGMQST